MISIADLWLYRKAPPTSAEHSSECDLATHVALLWNPYWDPLPPPEYGADPDLSHVSHVTVYRLLLELPL